MERFNLKNLSKMKFRKQFQIELLKRFAALDNVNDSDDINRAWENIKENIKFSAKETLDMYGRKKHKQWFIEECSQFLGQRKQAKIQRLRDPNQSNVDNLDNASREANRYFMKKINIWKTKIN